MCVCVCVGPVLVAGILMCGAFYGTLYHDEENCLYCSVSIDRIVSIVFDQLGKICPWSMMLLKI